MSSEQNSNSTNQQSKGKVAFFATCIVDLLRPSVGFASLKLLEQTGYEVFVPRRQTCCGQPAYNSGARKESQDIARKTIQHFQSFDYIVAPSGSCAAMLKLHYPQLLEQDDVWFEKAKRFGEKVYEITQFLTLIANVKSLSGHHKAKVAYHTSCSNMRELNNRQAPVELLEMVEGVEVVPFEEQEACCGFGGLFSVKYADISAAMVERKASKIEAVEPDMLVAVDLGCLLNIAGKLSRKKSKIEVRHITELLADHFEAPPLSGSESKK